MKLNKTYEIHSFKALPETDDERGRFEAIVSVFGNVDYQGDRVMPGAFAKSLEKWRKSGDPIPIIWSHNWGDPMAHIGWADPNDVEEIMPGKKDDFPGGLLVRGHLDVHKPFAAQVYDLMKTRRVKEFSFAYDVIDEKTGKDGANELHELDIIEVGPTLKGANPETVMLGVKSQLERAAKREDSLKLFHSMMELDPELARAIAPSAFAALEAVVEGAESTATSEDDTKSGADAKPWRIEERDGKFCVIKETTNEVEACHDTREEAEAHMRALYASEADADAEGIKASSGEKAGRVIGAKTAAALKARISEAIDAFVDEVNSSAAATAADDDDGETKIDELALIKAKLDALDV